MFSYISWCLTKERRTIWLIVAVQLLVIALIFIFVLTPKEKYSVSLQDDIGTMHSSPELKYFIEPEPDSYMNHMQPPWQTEEPVVYKHNALGARDNQEYNLAKSSTTFRIVLLGDSHSYGLFVDVEDTLGELLEQRLNNDLSCRTFDTFELLNLAYPNYDIEYERERLRLRGIQTEPDLVIWNINQNDVTEISEFILSYYQEDYVGDKNAPDWWLDALPKAMDKMFQKYSREGIIDYQFKKLKSLRDIYTSDVLLFTTGHAPSRHIDDDIYYSLLEDSASEIGAQYLQINDKQILENGLFPDLHLNQQGHRLVANYLFEYLVNSISSSCEQVTLPAVD